MKRFSLPVAFTSYVVTPIVKLDDHGKCEFDLRTIVIERQERLETERLIIWHEFFHALLHEYGHAELRDDEAFVESLAIAVMRVRTEQPWL